MKNHGKKKQFAAVSGRDFGGHGRMPEEGEEEEEMEVHDLLADMTEYLEDKDEKLTPAQVSKNRCRRR